MRIARPVPFPLHLIIDGACGCGYAGCTRVGKHPACEWGDVTYGSPVPRPEPGAGVGLRTGVHPTGSDVIVIDLDGEDAVAAWEDLGGSDETYTVETGRRVGLQLYFQPEPGLMVRNSRGDLWHNGLKGDDAQGIDVRGEGGYVVAEGSPHRSGKTYRVFSDVPVARMPAWLVAWFAARPQGPSETQTFAGDVDGEERDRRIRLYREYLATAPACIQGNGGDEQLFVVVQRGAYDLALPVEDVLSALHDVYDQRCVPPWGAELDERVAHKARTAKTGSTRPAMRPLPEDLAFLVAPTTSAMSALDDIVKNVSERVHGTTAPAIADGPIVWGGWDKPISPPVYLLDGLIPEEKVVTFFAEGGSLKTWAAFSLAIAVAKGQPWLGRAVQQGRALYLDYEDGRYEFQRRMQILQGLQDIPDLGYWQYPPPLDDVDLWKTLAPLGLKLIVVDALSSGVSAEVDENDRSFSTAVKMGGRLTEAGCTIVFVHHANKQGGMRGSSTVRDQSDVVFKFEPVSETDSTKRMRMICDKPGPQKRPLPVNVELSDAGLCTFEDEANAVGRNAKTTADVEAAVLLALTSGAKTTERIRKDFGGGKDRVDAAVRLLKSEGKIFSRGKFEGWELDDDDRRRGRVLQAAETSSGSAADLADAAFVPSDFIATMVRAGSLLERVPGKAMGFIPSEHG